MAKNKKSDTRKELEAEYKHKAKIANDRLRLLEKLAQKEGYEDVLNYSYRIAMRDLKGMNVRGKGNRFNLPKSTNQLQKALRAVDKFLDAPTSLKSTIDVMNQQNVVNFNKAFGTNFTQQELANFTQSVNWNDLKKEYDSAKLQLVIRRMKMKSKRTPEVVKEHLAKHKNLTTKDEVMDDVESRLRANGINLNSLRGHGEYHGEDFNSIAGEDNNDNPFIN